MARPRTSERDRRPSRRRAPRRRPRREEGRAPRRTPAGGPQAARQRGGRAEGGARRVAAAAEPARSRPGRAASCWSSPARSRGRHRPRAHRRRLDGPGRGGRGAPHPGHHRRAGPLRGHARTATGALQGYRRLRRYARGVPGRTEMTETPVRRRRRGRTPATLDRPPHGPAPANLADILERVLDKGIIIAGDIKVNLLDIELLTIKIRLLIVSVDKAEEMGIDWWRNDPMLSSERAGPRRREPRAARAPRGARGGLGGRADPTMAEPAPRHRVATCSPWPGVSAERAALAWHEGCGGAPLEVVEHGGLQAVVCTVDLDGVRRGGAAPATSRTWPGSRRWPAATTTSSSRSRPRAARSRPCAWSRSAGRRQRRSAHASGSSTSSVHALDRVEGRQEWSVKVYATPDGDARAHGEPGRTAPATGRERRTSSASAQQARSVGAPVELAAGGGGDLRDAAARSAAARRAAAAGPAADRAARPDDPQRRLPRADRGRRGVPPPVQRLVRAPPGAADRGRRAVAAVLLRHAGLTMSELRDRRRAELAASPTRPRSRWSTCSTGCWARAWCWPATS